MIQICAECGEKTHCPKCDEKPPSISLVHELMKDKITQVNLTKENKYLLLLLARKWHLNLSEAIRTCLKNYLAKEEEKNGKII